MSFHLPARRAYQQHSEQPFALMQVRNTKETKGFFVFNKSLAKMISIILTGKLIWLFYVLSTICRLMMHKTQKKT